MIFKNQRLNIAALATIDNIMAGSAFEFMPFDTFLQIALVASADGLVATVLSGSDVLMEESPLSTQDRFPLFPEDFDLDDIAGQGERLVIRIRETANVATTDLRTVVRFNPVAL